MWRITSIKKIYAGIFIVTFTISNAFFGFPVDFFINKINESKIVDNLYWAMKDKDIIDRGDINIPTVVKQALAAQSTIDNTTHTTATSQLGSSPKTVFISQSTGYAFYRDSDGDCSYSKTTNSGASWGTPVNITNGVTNLDNDCLRIAVWWDQWTPGDSGSLIHMAVIDGSGTAAADDDIWYATINTASSDANSGFVNITTAASYAGSLAAGTNYVTISKGTDGALYAAVSDASANILRRCTTTCTTASNWSTSNPGSWSVGNDFQILVPRLSGEVMLIWWDISATTNDLKYSRYTGSWSTFANIDTALDNNTYDASFGAIVDPSNGDIYLAYAGQAATLGTDDDVRARKFSGSSWSSLTDVVTDSACAGGSTCGITGVKISRDNNTGNLYVLYTAQSTAGTVSTGNIYWKYSTDSGSTWSSEFGPIYSSNDNIYGGNISLMPTANERIYSTWYAATPDDLFGRPIAPKTYEQSAYRFFANADSTDVGSALAAQDTDATLSSAGDAFRLRMLIHTGVSDLFTSEGSFKLQFAQQSGSCDTSFSGESYADVTSGTVIAYNNNATPSDGAALTANASDPTHSGDTIVNQTYEEANNFANSQGVVNEGQDGKWDFSLVDNGATANTAYCFRIVKSDGTQLDTYSVIPQITTANSAPVYSVSITSSGVVTYGFVELSTASSTVGNGYTQTAQNDGNTAEKLNVKSTDATGGTTWTLASSIGSNQFKHEFSTTTGSTWTTMTAADTYVTAAPSVAQSGTVNFDFRLTTPSASSDYQQKSITITIQAVAP